LIDLAAKFGKSQNDMPLPGRGGIFVAGVLLLTEATMTEIQEPKKEPAGGAELEM
jgi:hypothetical protein